MGRVIWGLIMVFAMEAGMYIFGGSSYSQTSLFYLFNDPTTFVSSSIYTAMQAVLVAVALAGIFIGSFIYKSETAEYAGFAALMLTFFFSIVHFWSFINAQLSGYLSENSWIVTSLILAPVMITFLMIILEYGRGRD